MKIIKALIPFLLILILKTYLLPDYSRRDTGLILEAALYFYMPYLIMIISGYVFFELSKRNKKFLLITLIIIIIDLIMRYGSVIMEFAFNIYIGSSKALPNFDLWFLTFFACFAIYNGTVEDNNVAAIIPILGIILMFLTNYVFHPSYEPFHMLQSFLHYGWYKAIGEPLTTVILLWINVFLSFYSILISKKKKNLENNI